MWHLQIENEHSIMHKRAFTCPTWNLGRTVGEANTLCTWVNTIEIHYQYHSAVPHAKWLIKYTWLSPFNLLFGVSSWTQITFNVGTNVIIHTHLQSNITSLYPYTVLNTNSTSPTCARLVHASGDNLTTQWLLKIILSVETYTELCNV